MNNVATKANDLGVDVEWGAGANGNTYYVAKPLSADALEINDVNGIVYKPFSGAGVIMYQPPVDLSIYTSARMQIRDSISSATVLRSFVFNVDLIIDAANSKITMQLSPTDTAAIAWDTAVYDLELITASGAVDCPIFGAIKTLGEVTR